MHYVLYALLVVVPAAGIALQFARGHSLPIFGPAEISSPWIADKAFVSNVKELHEVLAKLLDGCIGAPLGIWRQHPAAHVAASSQANVKASLGGSCSPFSGSAKPTSANHSHVR